jgi:hypothetical protein
MSTTETGTADTEARARAATQDNPALAALAGRA